MSDPTALAKINTHEEVCALRYDGINARLGRMEKIMITTAGATILALATCVASLLMRLLH